MSMRKAFAFLLAMTTTGCSTVMTIRQNTAAINASADTIRTNTAAICESTRGPTALPPALQGVHNLRAPLEAVAALSPTRQGVASLRDPMTRVAALDMPRQSVAALNAPMTRVAALE